MLRDACISINGEHGPPMRQRDARCGSAAEPGNLCEHELVFRSSRLP